MRIFRIVNLDWKKLRGIGAAFLIAGLLLPSRLSSQVYMDADNTGDAYARILSKGYNYEVPDCGHPVRHITEQWDDGLKKFVFAFTLHRDLDNDRCINFDRQRTEMKTDAGSPQNMKGSQGETHTYRWKFKLDAGFQPSPNFCHIHQLKAGDGPDADSPLMTITPRYGTPNQLQLIFTAPVENGGGTTTLTHVDLAPFLGTWVEVYEKVKYDFNSTYEIIIKRVSDDAVLLSYGNSNLNMWRTGTTFVRPKYGIYRSLLSISYLRDESVLFADFSLTEGTTATIPAAPGNLSATVLAGNTVSLMWADNSNNEDQFRIDRSTDSLHWAYLATTKMNSTTYSDTGLIASTPFYYRVRAENTIGNSDYSATAVAILPGVPPTAPANLTAISVSRSRINLTWVDNSNNESGFRLERSTNAGATWSVAAVIGANFSSYPDSSLSDSTTYYYRIRAENYYGTSGYSNTAFATTRGTPPVAPTNLTATTVSGSQVNLSWRDNSSDENDFRIERSADAGTTWSSVDMVGANVTRYSDTGLANSTTYYYRVRAENAYGNSGYSNTVNATTQEVGRENLALNQVVTASSEPQPENPATSAVDGNTDTRWSASGFPQWLEVDLGSLCSINKVEVVAYSDRAYQYVVEAKATTGGTYAKVVDRSANTTPGTIASPTADVFAVTDARYVRITISGAFGYTGLWASLLEFRVFGAILTGVSADAAIPLGFTLQNYPNPFNPTTVISYQLFAGSFVTLKVYDNIGREVATLVNDTERRGMHTLVWNAGGYASGTYLARLTAGNVTKTIKMILMK